jgi:hypothetical protein
LLQYALVLSRLAKLINDFHGIGSRGLDLGNPAVAVMPNIVRSGWVS